MVDIYIVFAGIVMILLFSYIKYDISKPDNLIILEKEEYIDYITDKLSNGYKINKIKKGQYWYGYNMIVCVDNYQSSIFELIKYVKPRRVIIVLCNNKGNYYYNLYLVKSLSQENKIYDKYNELSFIIGSKFGLESIDVIDYKDVSDVMKPFINSFNYKLTCIMSLS